LAYPRSKQTTNELIRPRVNSSEYPGVINLIGDGLDAGVCEGDTGRRRAVCDMLWPPTPNILARTASNAPAPQARAERQHGRHPMGGGDMSIPYYGSRVQNPVQSGVGPRAGPRDRDH
jgi:hypothetical protein